MEKNKVVLPMLVILAAVAILPLVSATTLVSPQENYNYTGTMLVNCTTEVENCSNCENATIWYNSAGDSPNTVLTTIANDTAGDLHFSESVDISSLSDATTYKFKCGVSNGTLVADNGISNSSNVSSVTVDNTNPSVAVSLDLESQTAGRYVHYTTTLSDATSGLNTQSCNATDPEDTVHTLSTSASSLAFKIDRTIDVGDWTFTCLATDWAGNSNTASETISIDSQGRVQKISSSGGGLDLGDSTLIFVIIGVILLIWLVKRK